ncbi:MAG: D-alanine--D-alanine ligase [Desulfurobacteriaceae bacterium]
MKVAVIYGGPSPEAEVSKKSAESVIRALNNLGHQVFPLELSPELPFKLREVSPDKAFLVLHGSPGEDGTVQGLLDIMGIPYTGCGVISSALSMDKDYTKRLLSSYGIPVPSGITLFKGDKLEMVEIPCIVKPARAGSSVGVTLVKEEKELDKALEEAFRYDDKVLVEEYLPGRELTVAVLNGRALSPIEIVPGGEFYDFTAKYSSPDTEYKVPAELPFKLERKLRRIAEKVYKVLDCRGAVRVDFRLNWYGSPFVLEVNTIPGLTERSLLPKAAQAEGISFEELIEEMLRT